jgi:polysaccharide export outer membrane protein
METVEHCKRNPSNGGIRRIAKRAVASVLLCSQVLMACAPPPSEPPAPVPEQERQLRPGDILHIEVWRQPEYSGEFRIGADGRLVHPLYNDVALAGLSESAARQAITEYLAGYLQGARLVVEPRYGVSVAGEVRQPNVYYTRRGTTIAEAIALAGGPTTRARMDQVLLTRSGTEYRLVLGAEQGLTTYGTLPVVSGDQILIEERSEFSVWRDVVAPVGTLASLVVAIIRISEKTGN